LHQWQGRTLNGTGKLTWLIDGSETGAIGAILFFFDHGEFYMDPDLLATNGIQLSQRGKRILAHELAGLIERALD